ncbi:hypothetical protein [Geosporobacter ferrireducens]|uniref:Lipoprotein n=1 Tax=Geosporobacter ferrireducens TaxID=1424294 RepID=A0A1D8GDJ1_9FIRM|nr:hypothetical protein [Geosporobacter ferrireducens]AOT68964.1 hypothetical protein Gferi_04985 [Geosporobacter ferrireducens]
MRKIIVSFFTIICIVGLLISCAEKYDNQSIKFSFDDNGKYTGFSNLPTKYTVEDAKKDGCFVKQDSKDIANKELWNSFIEDASKGKNTSIRIVKFYTETEDDTIVYFNDLFFDDDYYYLFDSSSENQKKQPYQYLLMLEGKFGNPLRDSRVVVLTNDNTLKFNDVMKSLVSSNMEYIKSVSPYRLVMFE